jgi:hypothetical protein
VLCLAHVALAQWISNAVHRLVAEDYVTDGAALERVVERALHFARSPVVLTLVMVFSLGVAHSRYWGLLSSTGALNAKLQLGHGMAATWYAWVALPLFTFLIVRAVIEWGAWIRVLWYLASSPLHLSAAHPDRSGGIEFIHRPSMAMALVIFAVSSVLASAWGTEIKLGDTLAHEYVDQAVIFVLIALALVLGPLLLFMVALTRTRHEGMRDYGRVAGVYVRRFFSRWVAPATPDEGLLGSSDIQSLADMANAFRGIDEMRLVPFGVRETVSVGIAALVPMLPLALTEVPLSELVQHVLHLVA